MKERIILRGVELNMKKWHYFQLLVCVVLFFGAALLKMEANAAGIVYNGPGVESFTGGGAVIVPDYYVWIDSDNIKHESPITEIKEGAFENTGITEIELPAYLSKIEKNAFKGCTSLKKVTFRDWDTYYGPDYSGNGHWINLCESAFEGCSSLVEVNFPNRKGIKVNITEIENSDLYIKKGAFKDCRNLVSINNDMGIAEIGESAFENCVCLGSVVSGKRVSSNKVKIGKNAFKNCTSIGTITLYGYVDFETYYSGESPSGGSNTYFDHLHTCERLSMINLINTSEKANGIYSENGVICSHSNNSKVYSVCYSPICNTTFSFSDTALVDLIRIDPYAFYDSKYLYNGTLPENCRIIGAFAFYNSAFSSITVHDALSTEINGDRIVLGKSAFAECKSLLKLTLGWGVTMPEELRAAEREQLLDGTSNVTVYLHRASSKEFYEYCKKLKIKLYHREYEDHVFPSNDPNQCMYCLYNKMDAYIGKTVSVKNSTGTIKFTITGSKTAKLISYKAKTNKLLVSSVTYKNSIFNFTEIGEKAFYGNTKVTKLEVGTYITKIGKNAFANCKNLAEVKLGSGVEVIGASAFNQDKKLKTLTITSKKLTKKGVKNSLKGSSISTIKVPSAKVSAYKKIFTKANAGKKVSVKKK